MWNKYVNYNFHYIETNLTQYKIYYKCTITKQISQNHQCTSKKVPCYNLFKATKNVICDYFGDQNK
jgi:hypothetical protein